MRNSLYEDMILFNHITQFYYTILSYMLIMKILLWRTYKTR